MRAYRLHDASWSRIVTSRVRRPDAIADRLLSRRRPAQPIPRDGQLVLLACNQTVDPRTSARVDRRELLDRIIEAISIPEVDGVIASANLLEELTLLNVLEHRLAICTESAPATIAARGFDGAQVAQHWLLGQDSTDRRRPSWSLAADVAEMAAHQLPTIVDFGLTGLGERSEFDTNWGDWIDPIHRTVSTIATGSGVWLAIPAVSGLRFMAELTGFPVLLRDTDVPITPSAWAAFFQADLPLTIRGLIPGVSALFPLEGSVAEATAAMARAVRSSRTSQLAA